MTSAARKQGASKRRVSAALKIAPARASKKIARVLDLSNASTARRLRDLERGLEQMRGAFAMIRELQPPSEVTPEMIAAREVLYAEAFKDVPPPTDEEMTRAMSSWL